MSVIFDTIYEYKDGYNSKKFTYDTQDSLDEKIDRLTSMMRKLTAQDDNQNKQFKPKIYQINKEDKQEMSMIEITMIKEITRIDIDLIVEIGEHQIEVEEYRQSYRGRLYYVNNYRNYFRWDNFRETQN